ncbi:MAG: hypothetical protein ABEK50_13235 [bacterium]
MKASSSNSTRSNNPATGETAKPTTVTDPNSGPGRSGRTTSADRRERFLSCLIKHPGLPLLVRLVLTVGNWLPNGDRGLPGVITNGKTRILCLVLGYLPETVLIESYRRMVRHELIERLYRN